MARTRSKTKSEENLKRSRSDFDHDKMPFGQVPNPPKMKKRKVTEERIPLNNPTIDEVLMKKISKIEGKLDKHELVNQETGLALASNTDAINELNSKLDTLVDLMNDKNHEEEDLNSVCYFTNFGFT